MYFSGVSVVLVGQKKLNVKSMVRGLLGRHLVLVQELVVEECRILRELAITLSMLYLNPEICFKPYQIFTKCSWMRLA